MPENVIVKMFLFQDVMKSDAFNTWSDIAKILVECSIISQRALPPVS